MDKSSVETLRVIDSAWKWTENQDWLSRGLEAAQFTTGDVVCFSEMHVLLAEWELALNRIDEAIKDYQTAIKLSSKNERALLGISRLILISNRGDRDFAFSCLTQITSPLYKEDALELLSHYETHAVEILPKHISNEFIDQLRASNIAAPCSLLVTALYRLDRLDDASIPSELDSAHEKILFASLKGFWEGNEGELRKGIDIVPPGDKRDRLLIKLTHFLYFTCSRSEETLLQEISFKDTPEYIFYSSLICNSDTCRDGIAKMVLDSVINKKRRKFFLKQIFNSAKCMTGFSDLEFTLTVTALRSLSEIYISAKKYEKAISVLEMLCGLCRGDKRSLSRLGICYFHQRMWAEAVEALSTCGMEESYLFLAKALSKQQNWKGVVDLALKCGDKRMNEVTWKSLMRLH
jgi:tetratricopeptide (TPR) repeat protein